MKQEWFCFQVERFGCPKQYIGKCLTSLGEIKKIFPWSIVEGNLVRIYNRPKKVS